MNSSLEVPSGRLWTVDEVAEESRDESMGDDSFPLCRLVDATHKGVQSLAFSSAITINTVRQA